MKDLFNLTSYKTHIVLLFNDVNCCKDDFEAKIDSIHNN